MPDPSVAIVTGGGGILGSSMVARLAAGGFSVAVVDLDAASAGVVAQQVRGGGGTAENFVCDITDMLEVNRLRSRLEADLGQVDVLVNNAATKSPHFFEPFESFPLEDWNHVMNVNTTGVMVMCQVFGSEMAKRERGCIVNILSIYGIVAPDQRIYEGSEYEGRGINTPAVYSVSKAAVWGLTKYLAGYWGGSGVRVNAVTPGGIYSGQNNTFVSRYSARVPLARMGTHQDVAGAVAYLASPEAGYITGHNLVVDGGLTVW